MEKHEEEQVQALIALNSDLKVAYEEHQSLKTRVEALQAKHFLSPEEELEKKKLQKLKLAAKTKVLQFLEEHRQREESERPA